MSGFPRAGQNQGMSDADRKPGRPKPPDPAADVKGAGGAMPAVTKPATPDAAERLSRIWLRESRRPDRRRRDEGG